MTPRTILTLRFHKIENFTVWMQIPNVSFIPAVGSIMDASNGMIRGVVKSVDFEIGEETVMRFWKRKTINVIVDLLPA